MRNRENTLNLSSTSINFKLNDGAASAFLQAKPLMFNISMNDWLQSRPESALSEFHGIKNDATAQQRMGQFALEIPALPSVVHSNLPSLSLKPIPTPPARFSRPMREYGMAVVHAVKDIVAPPLRLMVDTQIICASVIPKGVVHADHSWAVMTQEVHANPQLIAEAKNRMRQRFATLKQVGALFHDVTVLSDHTPTVGQFTSQSDVINDLKSQARERMSKRVGYAIQFKDWAIDQASGPELAQIAVGMMLPSPFFKMMKTMREFHINYYNNEIPPLLRQHEFPGLNKLENRAVIMSPAGLMLEPLVSQHRDQTVENGVTNHISESKANSSVMYSFFRESSRSSSQTNSLIDLGTRHKVLFERYIGEPGGIELKDVTVSGFARHNGEWKGRSWTLNDNQGEHYAKPEDLNHATKQMSDYELNEVVKAAEEFLRKRHNQSACHSINFQPNSTRLG